MTCLRFRYRPLSCALKLEKLGVLRKERGVVIYVGVPGGRGEGGVWEIYGKSPRPFYSTHFIPPSALVEFFTTTPEKFPNLKTLFELLWPSVGAKNF